MAWRERLSVRKNRCRSFGEKFYASPLLWRRRTTVSKIGAERSEYFSFRGFDWHAPSPPEPEGKGKMAKLSPLIVGTKIWRHHNHSGRCRCRTCAHFGVGF